jgi:1,4-alpha-glucan branching enzyme
MDLSALINKYVPQDDIYLYNTGAARKAWLLYGCRYIPEEGLHRFVLWAPNARGVSLVGDFNGWDADKTPMTRVEGGAWCAFVPGLENGSLYKYAVTGADGRTVLKSDPFAFWSQTGSDTASKVWNTKPFLWRDGPYMEKRPARNPLASPMSIYEVHLGSWRNFPPDGGPVYRQAADALAAYCRDMGYTHAELLPITEYPFPASWGYQVTGYYAPTSRYGAPEDFMYFVDRLHRAGIGVIIDWVPAHFPRDEHGLARFDGTPLFECKEQRMAEHPEWGTLIFDYAMPEVQSFLISSACSFFENYHVDGIRVDAVSSMLYLDYGRKSGEWTPNKNGGNINLGAVEFLRGMNEAVLTGYPGAVTIAEESTAYPMVTYPPADGGLGFTFKWDMGFMHDTLDYMATDPYFRSGCHDRLTFSMMYAFSENFILAYSHDEVVHGKCSMINKMSGPYDQKFASLRTLYGYQFAHPGKKLTFMGSEFGQFIEWNYEKELDWMLLDYPKHEGMRQYTRALNRLYRRWGALYEIDKSWDGFKWLNVDDRDRSSVAFLRTGITAGRGKYLVCVCNFTPVTYEGFVIGLPMPGRLREILSSDDEKYGGSGLHNVKTIHSRKEPFLDMEYSAALTLPGMSAVYFSYQPEKPDA